MMNCSALLGGSEVQLEVISLERASLNIRMRDIFWDLVHSERSLIKGKWVFRFYPLKYIRLLYMKSLQSAHH